MKNTDRKLVQQHQVLFDFTQEKLIHFLVFVLLFVTMSFLSLVTKANLLVYNLIVLFPSVVYLFYLNQKTNKKILLDGLILGFFGEILFDLFAHRSKSWFSPSMFMFRPFDVPIENFIWVILYVLLVFFFYEYFFDSSKGKTIPATHRLWITIVLLITFILPVVYSFFPLLFVIPYFYLIAVVIMVMIDYFMLRNHPKFATKAVLASIALLPLAFVHEFVSLELKHWIFEIGQHVAYLNLFGYLIPFEELIFYLAAPIMLICIYELFIDNKKA